MPAPTGAVDEGCRSPIARRRSLTRGLETGFSLIEMLIVVAIIGIIAAIATPALIRARIAGNESSAIGGLRTINSAQFAYAASCGNGSFATALPTLGIPPPSGGQPFLNLDLTSAAAVQKSGYTYSMNGGIGVPAIPDCNNNATSSNYYAWAVPMTLGHTGTRGFATNSPQSIWQDTTGAAPAEPFTAAGTISPVQ